MADIGAGAQNSERVSDKILSKFPLLIDKPVLGMAVMGNTVWVTRFLTCNIEAYPLTPPHKPQKILINELAFPRYIVGFPPGESKLVISDDNKLLWIKLDRDGDIWKVTSQNTVHVNYSPWGLGIHDNQLLVCDDKVIHVFTESLKETHTVDMCTKGVLPHKAWGQLASPGFVVMDRINKQVVLVTEEGEIQQTYHVHEGFIPSDIVCHGIYIYVTSLGYIHSRIDQLSVNGHHIRQMITEHNLRMVHRLFVDDNDRMYFPHGGVLYMGQEVWTIQVEQERRKQISTGPTAEREEGVHPHSKEHNRNNHEWEMTVAENCSDQNVTNRSRSASPAEVKSDDDKRRKQQSSRLCNIM